jgi:GLPGLI family protein
MKKKLLSLLVLVAVKSNAQQFISTGKIEYEVRVNNHRMFGDGIFGQMFKDKMPNFSTTYYNLTFTDNKALYKFDRLNERDKMPWNDNSREDDTWFSDYNTQMSCNSKFVFDGTYLLSDTLMDINWKLVPNETREIAGFTCRKAQGIIFDSVYVFAFYTDEITTNGGPMGIHGLPGMILGVTIPRMFTSWIATKLEVNGVNTSIVTAPTKGKKKDAGELKANVEKATKDWGTWGKQSVWNIFL